MGSEHMNYIELV